jgi:hypothetical protein
MYDMQYMDDDHQQFIEDCLARCGRQTREYVALFYVLGISCRDHINQLYDFDNRLIKWDGLHDGWVTGAAQRIIKLAFNLYTHCTEATVLERDEDNNYTDKDLLDVVSGYTPINIFDYGGDITLYMLYGVMIRFGLMG